MWRGWGNGELVRDSQECSAPHYALEIPGLWSELRVELVVELCSDVRALPSGLPPRSMAVHASASAAGTGGLMVIVDAAELLRSRADLDLRVGVSAYGSVSWMSEMLLPLLRAAAFGGVLSV